MLTSILTIEHCISNASRDVFIPLMVSLSNHARGSLRQAQAERTVV